MRTKKSDRYFTLLFVFIGLSFLWIGCDQSSTGDGAEITTATTDTSITEIIEMKPPGSIIPKDSAAAWVKKYRNAGGGPFSTQIVMHDPMAVKFYMDSIFYKYTAKITLPQGHIWRLAFSPMFFTKPGAGQKLSLCIVPCIVDTSSARVYDFFTEMEGNTDYYKQYYLPLYNSIGPLTIKGTMTDSTTRGFVFNEGQLWP
ncbi:hypothetical protein [Lacibacter sp. H407]|uniref:hypothetical protein n=1 Tax=Lacibacter sp. H407 TaxID=3133423 RepID=UPI0030C63DF7